MLNTYGENQADCATLAIDGLIVAIEAQDMYLKKKSTWTRKIVLLTDGETPMEIEDWEATVKRMNDKEIQLSIVYVQKCPVFSILNDSIHSGVDFDDDEMPFHEEHKSDIKVIAFSLSIKYQSLKVH